MLTMFTQVTGGKDRLIMTETEFLHSYMAVWGEDETYALIERGFVPLHTDHGWKWIYSPNHFSHDNALDSATPSCYAGAVGVRA